MSARADPDPIYLWQDKFKRSPIHLAALCGRDDFLREMIEEVKRKMNEAVASAVKARGLDGMTPIHLAVKGQHAKCVEALLKYHKPTELDVWGRAPIHLAAAAPNLDIAKKLLDKDSRPDQADTFGRTPLTYLRFLKDQKNDMGTGKLRRSMAEEFMKVWRNFDDKDDNGMTVLHYAVEFLDDEEIERYYLKRGAAADTADKNGKTPLHLAVSAKRGGVANVLFKYGAKSTTKDYTGMTPLMLAYQTGQSAVAKSLMKTLTDSEDQWGNSGQTTLMKTLTNAEDQQDNSGRTALHYAIESREFSKADLEDIVEVLASNMKNIDLQTRDGRTALHTAIIASKISVALKLLDHHAKPGTADKDGKLALHHVAQANTVSSAEVEELIGALIATWEEEEKMANSKLEREARPSSAQASQDETIKIVDARDGSLRTPLHEAILADNATVVHALLRRGADLKIKDSLGRSSLHHVAVSNQIGSTPVKDSLISTIFNAMETGINDLDQSEQTPLHVAMKANNDFTSLFLLNHGANPGTMDADGFTPLISAVREGFCLKAVNHIVRNSGEEIVNQADLSWDESPISWACERGQAETVKILLDAPNVHPNRRATGYRNRTPLQIALVYDRVAVIEILLDSPRVVPSWDIADEDGRKPLQYALEYCSEECIRALLLHSQTSAAIRIDALKIMAGMGNHEHIDIIKSILESVEEQSLPTSELDDLIHRFPTLDSNKTVFDAWMRRVKDPKRWNEVPHVLHTLALSGDGDTILRLLKLGANIYEPDDDNWTCIDVAKRNGNPKLKDVLMKHIPKPPPEKLPYLRPSSFANPFDEANVTLADCNLRNADSHSCAWAKGNDTGLTRKFLKTT